MYRNLNLSHTLILPVLIALLFTLYNISGKMCEHSKTAKSENHGRHVLPASVSPSEYWLHITPNMKDFTFAGQVRIRLHITEATHTILLNAAELQFDHVQVEGQGHTDAIPADTVTYQADDLTATIPLTKPLAAHTNYFLNITYRGTINDKLCGFYKSTYKTADDREIILATTQFEAVDARRAFPCWDEPAHKAVFHIVITAPSHMKCLSNTHVVSQEAAADLTTYTYAPTPKMSTYLVAWTIGELDSISTVVRLPYTQQEDTIVSVYTPLGKSAQGQFALDVALRVLPLYEKFFDHGYNLKKMDLVAIPDFAAGAMENWGLITYREAAVLCDDQSSASHRQYVAIVVCHEIAHQWFGNLVTMEWWQELWLNEAFATFMEYWAVDKLFPEWNIFTQFAQAEVARAMDLDARHSSHPVEVDVRRAQEIDEIFDAISYCKGGGIVRMIIEYIGETAFQKGISAYINHFKYRNACTVDLWRFLGEGAGKDLTPIMEYWTARQGYPWLRVSSDDAQASLTVTQDRFLATGDAATKENETVWQVPLLVTTPEGGERAVLLDRQTVTVPVAATSWVKVNSRQTAFCRVMYAGPLLESLKVPLREKTLCSLDRLGIMSDYSAFAQAGYVSTVQTLELMQQFVEKEDDFVVWSSVVEFEVSVRRLLSATCEKETVERYNAYCCRLYSNAMQRVGYKPKVGESQNDVQLRALLFGRLAAAKDPEALTVARGLYANRNSATIPADLHGTVFTVHVCENGAAAVAEVKKLIADSSDAVGRSRYLRSLGAAAPNAVSVSDLFDYCFSNEVRAQDTMYLLAGIASDSRLVKDFATQVMLRWSHMIQVLPGMMVGRCIKFIENGADATVAESLRSFWATVSDADKLVVGRSFLQGLEGLENNAAWAARDVAAVEAWLA